MTARATCSRLPATDDEAVQSDPCPDHLFGAIGTKAAVLGNYGYRYGTNTDRPLVSYPFTPLPPLTGRGEI